MSKQTAFFFGGLVALLMAGGIDTFFFHHEIKTITHTEYYRGWTDTTYMPGKIVHDTLRLAAKHVDTIGFDIVSSIDTCFKEDSSSVCIGVEHH